MPFKQTHIAADACRAEARHRPISPRPFNCRLASKHGCLLKHFVLVRPQGRQPFTRVAQLSERGASDTEDEGETPSASAISNAEHERGAWNRFGGLTRGDSVPRSAFRIPRLILRMVGRAVMPRS